MPKTTPPDLCYVFCAVEGATADLPSTGMPDGLPARVIALDEQVSLVVADVPASVYAPATLEPRLTDLDWVGTAGAAHHAIVDALAEAGVVVVPFRLFTLFSNEARAVQTLRASRAAMERAFERVRGRQEWVLRISKPDPALLGNAEAPKTGTTAPASGTDFLQAKARTRRDHAARAQRVKEDAAGAYEALEQLADEATIRTVDPQGTLLLEAALLVPPTRIDAMHETLTRRAARLLQDGCAVSFTGPWPPYSFASLDAGDE